MVLQLEVSLYADCKPRGTAMRWWSGIYLEQRILQRQASRAAEEYREILYHQDVKLSAITVSPLGRFSTLHCQRHRDTLRPFYTYATSHA
jgi:hypothetical protein